MFREAVNWYNKEALQRRKVCRLPLRCRSVGRCLIVGAGVSRCWAHAASPTLALARCRRPQSQKIGMHSISRNLYSRVPTATIKLANISGVQSNGYVGSRFIFWLRNFKARLECRNDQGAIGYILASPVFDHMFDPETAELWWIGNCSPAKPPVAKINLFLINLFLINLFLIMRWMLAFSRSMAENSAWDNRQ